MSAAARLPSVIFPLLFVYLPVSAQVLLSEPGTGETVQPHWSSMAVFEAGEERQDLPCAVNPEKPELGFDLRFHTGYEVALPLRDFAGQQNRLTVVFRVTAENSSEEPSYFTQLVQVPPIAEDAKGEVFLQGYFDVGEGTYKVDWLMHDARGRICSSFWDIEAQLGRRDESIDLVLSPAAIRQAEVEQFRDEPPVQRMGPGQTLNVKLLANFAPQNERAATLQPHDTSAIVSILRTVFREPSVGKFSLVAFNLHEQRVIYRQDNADRIDFPALGEAVQTLELGTIDLARLSDKGGEIRFLADLVRQELGSENQPDAVIFVGPKAMLGENIPEEVFRSLGQLDYPVYYMNYTLNPFENPWRDTIGVAVRALGGKEFTISRPRDLWRAVTETVAEAIERKGGRMLAASSE